MNPGGIMPLSTQSGPTRSAPAVNGCVGDVWRNASCFTGRSSTGSTGKPVLPVEERPVKQDAFLHTSPTQPFTAGADRVGPDCVDKGMIPPGFIAGCYFDPIGIDSPNQYMPHMNMRQTPM